MGDRGVSLRTGVGKGGSGNTGPLLHMYECRSGMRRCRVSEKEGGASERKEGGCGQCASACVVSATFT
jgi:hypothetical protein